MAQLQPRTPARERLIRSASALFALQGVRETTTRQIAERAGVNEVTLFRQFGNKQGLLLALIEESNLFDVLRVAPALLPVSRPQLRDYIEARLSAFEQLPEFVLSLVAETADPTAIERQTPSRQIPDDPANQSDPSPSARRADLLDTLLLGWTFKKWLGIATGPQQGRADFLESVAGLFEQSTSALLPDDGQPPVHELSAAFVHRLLDSARKSSPQDYALLYVLFAAGLSAAEVSALQRTDWIGESDRQLLQVGNRQVPLNRQILGKRYGSSTHNPLSRWLKSRRDQQNALFLNEVARPLSVQEVQFRWEVCIQKIVAATESAPTVEQAQQTWRVEMLLRGIDLDTLAILSGQTPEQLQPFARRAREKLALEKALQLDG
ncbi:TetR family transcriptional regulator [Gloeobacter kilaueensis]|uniref:TetR family transcriptional regulator n=1 Tax=Gloeobacter kilaueensis (strain ATCC BAA-2537 / CCAP 1431/1 / ULC 316 / JS1) TaxID=1183438 RepID=U5QIR1_GLOK1|nr:TetR family transcriptional regulator [Gloeobacter kilaueensis]AGY58778.1 TetR family transcriptional regulator [Gloeobacter kilaueensis JS1]